MFLVSASRFTVPLISWTMSLKFSSRKEFSLRTVSYLDGSNFVPKTFVWGPGCYLYDRLWCTVSVPTNFLVGSSTPKSSWLVCPPQSPKLTSTLSFNLTMGQGVRFPSTPTRLVGIHYSQPTSYPWKKEGVFSPSFVWGREYEKIFPGLGTTVLN